MAAKDHDKDRLSILPDDIRAPHLVARAMQSQETDRCVLAAAATVRPQIGAGRQQGYPALLWRSRVLDVGFHGLPGTNEGFEISITARGDRQPAFVAAAVTHQSPARDLDNSPAPIVIFI